MGKKLILAGIITAVFLIHCSSHYQLRGKVENPAFQPVPGARVIVAYPGSTDSLTYITDASGHFLIKGLKNPQIQLFVRAPEYVPYEEFVTLDSKTASKTIQLQFQKAQIVGRVIDATSNESLHKVQIAIMGTNIRTISGLDGRFTIGEGELESNITYELVFTRNGYRTESKIITINEPRTYDLGDIPLTRLAPREIPKANVTNQYGLSGSEDIETTSTLGGVGVSPEVQRFLEENETFNYLQFRRVFAGQNLSDKAIRDNLRVYIEQGLIRQVDENTFESIVYKRKYHLK